MPHRLNQPPYPADALEPHLSEAWVRRQLEWQEGYLNRLDSLLAGTGLEDVRVEQLLARLGELPEDARDAVRESACGCLNHTLLWSSLGPDGGGEPGYEFLEDIEQAFGSFPSFQAAVHEAAAGLAGDGWVWLQWNGHALEVVATEGERNPADRHHAPLLGIDLWEHATEGFADVDAYLRATWHVVDWRDVGERFLTAEEASRERGEIR